MRKTILTILTLLLLILSACAVQQEPAEGKKELVGSYKIGVMLPLTGDAAAYGLSEQRGIKIALDEINSKGGVNGKKLEAIYEDSKCNPKDGNAAAQKLVNVDKVKVIVGGACSGETLGAAPITEANKVILISPTASSPDVTNAGDFVFRTYPTDAYAGIIAANYAYIELKARKAALVTESTDYAQGLRKVFKENFAKLGGEVVADETYNPDDTDFRTQVTKVKSTDADLIYIVPQTPVKGLLLLKQIKELGLTQPLLTAEVLIGKKIVIDNPTELEGLYGVEFKFDEKTPKAAALLLEYKRISGEEPEFPSFIATAYDAVQLIADAIGQQGYDSEKIRDYLYAVKDYNGAAGKITMDENGDPIMEYSVKKIKNGELIILE
ncbi:ABC transporter substrate-binding protein [Candidatus Woesearchaeota archaeon]|nr:ABC transporter substrate-binding protein [Candidatus Woesearchaeota archaeon]